MSAVATAPPAQPQSKPTICSSRLVSIYDVPFSNLYEAEVTLPDGTKKWFLNLRAYASLLNVDADGYIELRIEGKSQDVPCTTVKYPFYYIHRDVLCAIKRFTHEGKDSFALNYDLFCLNWKTCLLIHEEAGTPYAYITSRSEWEKKGVVDEQNREVQIFLGIDNFQRFEVETLKSIAHNYVGWINAAVATCKRKVR